jgi:hypothetical protein
MARIPIGEIDPEADQQQETAECGERRGSLGVVERQSHAAPASFNGAEARREDAANGSQPVGEQPGLPGGRTSPLAERRVVGQNHHRRRVAEQSCRPLTSRSKVPTVASGAVERISAARNAADSLDRTRSPPAAARTTAPRSAR